MIETGTSKPSEWSWAADILNNGDVLECGQCHMDAIHPTAVTVNRGGVVTLVDSDGEHIDPCRKPSGRGVLIRLDFECECGHSFFVAYQFHKGFTCVLRHWTDDSDSLGSGTIWRD